MLIEINSLQLTNKSVMLGIVCVSPSFIMEPPSVETTDLLCRTCLCFIDDDDCISITQNIQLCKMYVACTSLEIDVSDEYPKNICESCFHQLKMFNDFKKMCNDTLVRFKDFLKSSTAEFLQKEAAALMQNDAVTSDLYKKINLEKEKPNMMESNSDIKNKKQISFDSAEKFKDGDLNKDPVKADQVKHAEEGSLIDTPEQSKNKLISFMDQITVTPLYKAEAHENYVLEELPSFPGIFNKCVEYKFKSQKGHIENLEDASQLFDIPSHVFDAITHKQATCQNEISAKNFPKNSVPQAQLYVHKDLEKYAHSKCDKQFAHNNTMRTHEHQQVKQTHETYDCTHNDCSSSFSFHSLPRQTDKCPSQQVNRVHVCDICEKKFKRKVLLSRHRFVHMDKCQLPFECNECGKRFKKKLNLKYHLNRHAGIKDFVCTYCGMKKTTKSELMTHINYHTLEKTWPCTACEKIFNSLGNLKMHIRTVHDGARDYACRYCHLRFGKAGTLKYHEMRHTGEKPHLCKICGQGFIQAVALRTHMKGHEGNY